MSRERDTATYVPLFAYLFGIREWEMDRLTMTGFDQCKQFADDWLARGQDADKQR